MSNFALPMDLPGFDAAVRDTQSAFAPARLAAAVSFSLVDETGITDAVRYLHGLLDDPVPEIRSQSVESLAALAERGATVNREKLTALLKDPFAEVAAAVLQSGELLLSQPEDAALQAAASDAEILRYSAAVLLGSLDSRRSRDALCKLLSDGSEEVRVVAALQLGHRGNEQSVNILLEVIQKRHPASLTAIQILADAGLPVCTDVLRELAAKRFGGHEHRAMALAALARLEGGLHREILQKQLQSLRKSRRLSALRACAAIPVEAFAEPLAAVVLRPRTDEDASAALYALSETVRLFPHLGTVLDDIKRQLPRELMNELTDYTETAGITES
jgi:HEAT repeat protein